MAIRTKLKQTIFISNELELLQTYTINTNIVYLNGKRKGKEVKEKEKQYPGGDVRRKISKETEREKTSLYSVQLSVI